MDSIARGEQLQSEEFAASHLNDWEVQRDAIQFFDEALANHPRTKEDQPWD